MKKKYIYIGGAILLALLLLLSGIAIGQSHSYNYSDKNYISEDYVSNSEYGDTYGDITAKSEEAPEASASDEGSLFSQTEKDQKLVYSGDVTIGTDNIQKSYDKVTEKMKEHNAVFESVNESSYYKTMIIRVPKDNFLSLYESLSEVDGSITSSNVSIDDMTKSYTDNERRLDILKTEYNELKDLMKKTDNVEDILSIRGRLSEITYEIEELQGTNDNIDYDANFSRLEVTLQLTGNNSPVSFWYQIKEAFHNSISAIKGLFLFLIEIWWIILLIVCGVFFFIKRKKKVIGEEAAEIPNAETEPQNDEPQKTED